MTTAYEKQLEAENEKLRETLELQDKTIGELIRKKLEVKKDKDGRFYLRLKNKEDMSQLTDVEVLVLMGIDTKIVAPSPAFPDLSINDLVGVQPMFSSAGASMWVNYVNSTAGTSSPQVDAGSFSNISMPMIQRVFSQEEVDAAAEDLKKAIQSCEIPEDKDK